MKKFLFLLSSVLIVVGAGCNTSVQKTRVPDTENTVQEPEVTLSGEAQKAKIECEKLSGIPEVYISDINIPDEKRIVCKFADKTECDQIDLNDGFCKR